EGVGLRAAGQDADVAVGPRRVQRAGEDYLPAVLLAEVPFGAGSVRGLDMQDVECGKAGPAVDRPPECPARLDLEGVPPRAAGQVADVAEADEVAGFVSHDARVGSIDHPVEGPAAAAAERVILRRSAAVDEPGQLARTDHEPVRRLVPG